MFTQNRGVRLVRFSAPVALLLALLAAFVFASGGLGNSADREGARLTEQSIRRASVQCYALEGAFAPNFEYLKENYGLSPDETRYTVHYIYTAANLTPEITVIDNRK